MLGLEFRVKNGIQKSQLFEYTKGNDGSVKINYVLQDCLCPLTYHEENGYFIIDYPLFDHGFINLREFMDIITFGIFEVLNHVGSLYKYSDAPTIIPIQLTNPSTSLCDVGSASASSNASSIERSVNG
ncbi:unnamed protein product [Adineta steineri]|uniref:Uncharacterized protein n=1 Tax=Adineta steineri TaxID=433720 RepID=A0A814LX45_9BILA|nr:unnamed protein product [Adineta steineri]